MRTLFFVLCLLFSLPTFAGNTFVVWPLDQDQDFRQRYQEVVGEGIDAQPQAQTENHAMIGSSRITPEQMAILSDEFSRVEFYETIPTNMGGE